MASSGSPHPETTLLALLDRLPPRLQAPVRRVAEKVATSLWAAPLAAGLAALVIALVLLRTTPMQGTMPLEFQDADAVRSALTAILSATIAATSLAVTGTIIALQLATGQYSPRLLRGVLTDGGVRWTLAMFVATVVYVLVVITGVSDQAMPQAAVGVGHLLGVAVIALLVYFVHHIVQRLRLETIIGDVTRRTLAAVENTHPLDHDDRAVPDVPDHAQPLPATDSGYLQATSLEALAAVAANAEVHLRIRVRIGDYLTKGTTAAWAWRDDGGEVPDLERLTAKCNESLVLGVDRTIDGDPAYGVRHLVDVGLRAVSPGVNDPTTAVQAIDHTTTVLVALASRTVAAGVVEHDGFVTTLPKPDFGQILELAQTQLLLYGGGDPRVVDALATQLRDVLEAGTSGDRQRPVRGRLEELRADVERRDHAGSARELLDASLGRVEQLLTTGEDADSEPAPAG